MTRYKKQSFRKAIAILSFSIALVFVFYFLIGIKWFRPGDFSFRTAMAYHGILIPAWLMLLLAYSQHFSVSKALMKLYSFGAVFSGILSEIGALFIHSQGIDYGTIIQVTAMICSEILALTIIIGAFIYHFREKQSKINEIAWWTVSIALIGLSVATPLGHIAGAAKDLGGKFALFTNFVNHLSVSTNTAISGFVDSHSHQVLAAFLAAAFSLPFIKKSGEKSDITVSLQSIGLFVVLIATLAQIFLYQYCAWSAWEPPTLFSNGTNGIPLDDFVLSILGVGLLFLIPSLWKKREGKSLSNNYSSFSRQTVSVILIAYMVSVVGLGIFIEFHEQFFGHGESSAVGVINDLAYIRAHILFGFMIIAVLLSTLLNICLIDRYRYVKISLWFIVLLMITGTIGVYVWTFFLFPLILKICFFFFVLFLFFFAFALKTSKQ